MYELYIANKNYSSWSLRPWVLMRQLSIAFNERVMQFREGSNWASFREFSPNGKVPCLIDGQLAVWDSLAIGEYLAERNEEVLPKDAVARAWARCAAAEMHSGFGFLRDQCSMNCGVRVRLDKVSEGLQRDLDRIDELWNEGLRRFGGPFLAGSRFCLVDASFAPVAFRMQTYNFSLSPSARAYAERLLALPSMQDWYAAALAETWREPAHEAEMKVAGTLLQDYRQA